jgi:hypothetical protein
MKQVWWLTLGWSRFVRRGDTYLKTLLNAALLVTLVSATARAQINAGELKPYNKRHPFI